MRTSPLFTSGLLALSLFHAQAASQLTITSTEIVTSTSELPIPPTTNPGTITKIVADTRPTYDVHICAASDLTPPCADLKIHLNECNDLADSLGRPSAKWEPMWCRFYHVPHCAMMQEAFGTAKFQIGFKSWGQTWKAKSFKCRGLMEPVDGMW